jgi:hypothetical protein
MPPSSSGDSPTLYLVHPHTFCGVSVQNEHPSNNADIVAHSTTDLRGVHRLTTRAYNIESSRIPSFTKARRMRHRSSTVTFSEAKVILQLHSAIVFGKAVQPISHSPSARTIKRWQAVYCRLKSATDVLLGSGCNVAIARRIRATVMVS